MKSIMQQTKECYLCRKEAQRMGYNGPLPSSGLHRHHVIFGAGRRKKSEEYGLWVFLCAERHHEYGPDAVHNNKGIRFKLSQDAQKAFEYNYGSRELFMKEFGRNYLDNSEDQNEGLQKNIEGQKIEDGFIRIETGLDDMQM